ncbi:hypothetical protein HG530_006776 [Fusarium avenaceum]|nr:hypothetical protein HG530_006776 [Fusarium avenaceum]
MADGDNNTSSSLLNPLLGDREISILSVLYSLSDTGEGNGGVTSVQARSVDDVLVEFTVGKTTLGDEATLEVTVLVVDNFLENLVVALPGEFFKSLDLVGALLEGFDGCVKFTKVEISVMTLGILHEVFIVCAKLLGVVLSVEGKDIIGGEMVCQKSQVLSLGNVGVETWVTKGGHPVVGVVVGVVMPNGVAGSSTTACVESADTAVEEGSVIRARTQNLNVTLSGIMPSVVE